MPNTSRKKTTVRLSPEAQANEPLILRIMSQLGEPHTGATSEAADFAMRKLPAMHRELMEHRRWKEIEDGI